MPWIFVQSLKGIMRSCWIGLCGVFVVGYELPLLWNNMLTPREEIKRETNPLWSIEIRWQNVDVSKGFYEEVIFETNLFISVKPRQYAQISVCSAIGIHTKGKIFPLVFLVTSALVGVGSLWPCKPRFEKKNINKKHKKNKGKLFAFISHTIISYNLEQVLKQH
jgi:hypothetical protein